MLHLFQFYFVVWWDSDISYLKSFLFVYDNQIFAYDH